MTSKSRTEQEMTNETRDSKGRFVSGRSGNPRGRKQGATCRALKVAREAAEKIALPMLIEAAKGGDMDAARVLVAYGLPKQKPQIETGTIDFPDGATMTEKAIAVFDAVASGAISGEAGKVYLDLLGGVASLQQADELERRIANLERIINEQSNGRAAFQ